MLLDRTLQLSILEELAKYYSGPRHQLSMTAPTQEENHKLFANLIYLEQHGLVISGLTRFMEGTYAYAGSEITHRGMDFLAEDGGLTAIRGTVIVKLHDDTIRHLITSKIEASALPQPDKHRLLDQLHELRGESIKHLTMKLLDVGMENLPAVLHAIQTTVQGVLR